MDSGSNQLSPDNNVPTDGNLPSTVPNLPQIPPSDGSSPAVPAAMPAPANPAIADDTDLIEKEWVEKAKHIVEQTKDNPHLRNKEINKIKADYIKKRYNKDIQTTNE